MLVYKLFLIMEVDVISLDEAAKFLLGEGHEESNIRRDCIANMLSSLKLIEKVGRNKITYKPAALE